MRRRPHNLITYANVMATLALVLATTGTAYAAVALTGKNVKDGTLTGVDVKNGSLTAVDLSVSTRTAFKGATGATGPTGFKGLTGATGPKGDTGHPGAPAEVVTSFASRDTGFMVRNNRSTPNPSDLPWYDYNCAGTNTVTADPSPDNSGPCAADDGNQSDVNVGVIDLIASDTMVLALQGMTSTESSHHVSSNNNIQVPWNNNLTGMASVSLLHDGAAGSSLTVHERVECGLQYADSNSPSTFQSLGEPQMVSSFGTKEIVALNLIGSKNLPSGTYNVRVVCADMDYASNSSHGWRFIRGNLTAMAARNG